jgi:L-lysine 2,3-aminomutase
MAHFNHLNELKTEVVKQAVRNILDTGANIRTQSPVLTRINDKADMWADMWEEQVRMGMVPYYMFIVRDTGAQHYFGITLERAWKIYQKAITQVSGISRTVRGPSMSALPGKVEISGITEVNGEKFFVLRFLQGRNPDWCFRPFLAKYDPEAIWLNDLKPAFGKKEFFYQRELAAMKKFPIN